MTEIDYDERATNFATTNVDVFNTASSALVGGLSVTVQGTGAAVTVEFYAPSITHSGNAVVTSYFVTNGAVSHALGQYRKWTSGTGGVMRRRMVLANGVSYTFQVGLAGASSGITQAVGQITVRESSAGVMYLRVTD